MGSDKRHSQDKRRAANALVAERLAAGETPDEIREGPRPEYEMGPHETAAVNEFLNNPDPLPKFWIVPHIGTLAYRHPRQEVAQAVVMKAVGVSDATLFTSLVSQITNALSRGKEPEVDELNAAIALVAGVQPRDHLEAMLAFQMATVHILSLRHTRLMVMSDRIDQLDIHERVVNKLLRTFTGQMEALRKHRNGGNQKVVVEHVHVYEGGQAIVGTVAGGGRGRKEKGLQSHEQQSLSLSAGAAVLSHVEADRLPVQSAGGTREESMSLPRRAGRGTRG